MIRVYWCSFVVEKSIWPWQRLVAPSEKGFDDGLMERVFHLNLLRYDPGFDKGL
jgi:hypothetical protein